jgi:hypothetical protein
LTATREPLYAARLARCISCPAASASSWRPGARADIRPRFAVVELGDDAGDAVRDRLVGESERDAISTGESPATRIARIAWSAGSSLAAASAFI